MTLFCSTCWIKMEHQIVNEILSKSDEKGGVKNDQKGGQKWWSKMMSKSDPKSDQKVMKKGGSKMMNFEGFSKVSKSVKFEVSKKCQKMTVIRKAEVSHFHPGAKRFHFWSKFWSFSWLKMIFHDFRQKLSYKPPFFLFISQALKSYSVYIYIV